jgi:hypothetical protein
MSKTRLVVLLHKTEPRYENDKYFYVCSMQSPDGQFSQVRSDTARKAKSVATGFSVGVHTMDHYQIIDEIMSFDFQKDFDIESAQGAQDQA